MSPWGCARGRSVVVAVAFCALRSRAAQASEEAARHELDLRVPIGLGLSGDGDLAFDFSAQPTLRYRFLQGGVFYDAEARAFGTASSLYAFAAGLVDREPSGMRFELTGLLGARHYSGIGCDWGCSSGGGAATLPWAGARFDLSSSFSPSERGHFNFGFAAIVGTDLRHQNVNYTVSGGAFDFGGTGGDTQSGETRVGGAFISGQLVLGVLFDL